ncbi:NAD(P)-dependent oxidoreductase [Mesorhizobium sp.]|uniref:NAD-dependent epimerase/dehydratase family protein n=1 Tax=Mesorhizobium sp. TaxID=1871066 RepID=UPI00120F7D04|nr:NAD(P)-dependent oxidoreductase [Mesorhizobium sp.]TIS55061.1 MAG: NAD(P)-dependent oxidoreductase [Mesorhizobium sp.]TIS92947.1 MAG: NAD(P)-dependent oxidoreductase [Mesorhizobium sp.]
MSRILITGGAGFVGSHLTEACLKAGHQVHVVVRAGSNDERLEHLADRISRHRFDLCSEVDLKHCLRNAEPHVIYHLAANPRRPQHTSVEDAKENVQEDLYNLITLLGAAATTRSPPDYLIRAGSLAEYGLAPIPYQEEAREAPITVYSAGLVAATHYVAALQPRLPFPVATARLALVYGPSQSTDYLVPSLITRCLAGENSLVRRPADRRDLIFVDEVVEALQRMAAMPMSKPTLVNICSGVAPTMREVAQLVVEQTGAEAHLVQYGDGSPPSGAADLRGSPERARTLLGWQARIMLADGIRRTVRWYRDCAVHEGQSGMAATTVSPKHRGLGVT